MSGWNRRVRYTRDTLFCCDGPLSGEVVGVDPAMLSEARVAIAHRVRTAIPAYAEPTERT